MNTFIEMDYEDFLTTYKPIINHLDPNASFQDESGNGILFETYGEEVVFVKKQDPACIWMYGDGDDGGSFIWSGWGFVNRLGYIVTEVPCPPNTDIQIRVSHNWFFCESCHAEFEDPDNLIRDKFDDIDLQKCPECATLEEEETHNCEETIMQDNPTNEVEELEEVDPELLGRTWVDLR